MLSFLTMSSVFRPNCKSQKKGKGPMAEPQQSERLMEPRV
jgi:hypothetical protein